MTNGDAEPISANADLLGKQLLRMPLASARELRTTTGLSEDQTKRGLRELKRTVRAKSAELGDLQSGVPRYWLEGDGLDHMGGSDEQRSWHGAGALGNLVAYGLWHVEAVNAIAVEYATGGWKLTGIKWFERQPMTAAAEYSHPYQIYPAYLVICCVSMLDTQAQLCHRLEAIPAAMQAHTMAITGRFAPAGLAIVAYTEWEVVRALHLASALLHRWVPVPDIRGWHYREEAWVVSTGLSDQADTSLLDSPLPPLDSLLDPSVSVRKLGRRSLESIVARSGRFGRGWPQLLSLLTLVASFPVGAVSHYKDLVGEAEEGNETRDRMKRLKDDLKLLTVVTEEGRAKKPKRWGKGIPLTLTERGQGGHRYIPTDAAYLLLSDVHGGQAQDWAKRVKLGSLRVEKPDRPVEDQWPYQHQDILFEAMGQVSKSKSPFAPGWLARTTLATGQRIDPDAIILVKTPWGWEWCYLEVELSDRSYLAVLPRCQKYGSEHRRDDFPVLIVCYNDAAEANFRMAGLAVDPPPRMLTTTLRRLKDGEFFGEAVWSHYGVPVTLTPR